MVRAGLMPYLTGSALGMAATASHAFHTHEQFYPACIYLTTGKLHQLVVCNFLVASAICLGIFVKKATLGSLRASEVENLMDRLWPTIFDTLLLTTIFRGELTSDFFALFGILVFVSVFHWIVKDRVDYIATSPEISVFQYLRLAVLVGTLLLFDAAYVYYVYNKIVVEGPSYILLFGFEYALLLWTIICIAAKFCFNVVDTRLHDQWHNKAIYVLGAEFVEETQKFLTLIAFFVTIQAYYGVPLHILRRLIVSYRLFQKRFSEVVNYVRLARNMNQLVVNATREELENSDSMCVICREDMAEGKKLPCGHIFHAGCLRGWLGRSHECPTCRHSLLPHLQPNRRHRVRDPRQMAAQQQQEQLLAAQQEQQQHMMQVMNRQIEELHQEILQRQQRGRPNAQPDGQHPPVPEQVDGQRNAAAQPPRRQPMHVQAQPRQHRPVRRQPGPPLGQEPQPAPAPQPQPVDARDAREARDTRPVTTFFADPMAALRAVSDIQSQVAQIAAQLAGLQAILEQQVAQQAGEEQQKAEEQQRADGEAAAATAAAAVDATVAVSETATKLEKEERKEVFENEDVDGSVQSAETEVIAAPDRTREGEDPQVEASPTMAEIRQRRLLRFSSEA